ncbi:MAG: c(7)-type cytochrome triheme domain-containing protein, partial [Pseudomonadota bacterium]
MTFDGKSHADKGLKCPDCHVKPKLFEMKKGSDKITMAAMNEGKFCGTCHDGKKAFSVKAPADCVKCHEKGGAGAKADAKAPTPIAGENKSAKEK